MFALATPHPQLSGNGDHPTEKRPELARHIGSSGQGFGGESHARCVCTRDIPRGETRQGRRPAAAEEPASRSVNSNFEGAIT